MDLLKEVELGPLIGRGGFGRVYKGTLPLRLRRLACLRPTMLTLPSAAPY